MFLILCVGCDNANNIEVAYDVKMKKDAYQETVHLLKAEGDLLADQINRKLKLLESGKSTEYDQPTPAEIMKLQNNLILLQTRKIEEQEKYINTLEDTLSRLVDPEKEIIGAE
jgi:hypothetical protein